MSARHLVRLTSEEHAALVNILAVAVALDAGDYLKPETHAILTRVLKKVRGAPSSKRGRKKRVPPPA